MTGVDGVPKCVCWSIDYLEKVIKEILWGCVV